MAHVYGVHGTSAQIHRMKLQSNQNIICASQKSSLGWIVNSSVKLLMEPSSILPCAGIVLVLLFNPPFLFLDIPSREMPAVLVMKSNL